MIESIHRNGKDILVFDDATHRYYLNGNHVPGVTGVNKSSYPKSEALIKWMIKQGIEEYETQKKAKEAASIGSLVHEYVHSMSIGKAFERQQIDAHPDKEKIEKCIKKVEEWRLTNEDELVAAEQVTGSAKYRYGGTYDRLAKRGDLLVLSDYKTSSGIYPDMFIQLAGYAIALEEWNGIVVDGLEIIRFGKDGSFGSKLITDKKQMKAHRKQFIRNVETFYYRKEFDKQHSKTK